MSGLTQLKLGLALAGLILFGYGVRTDVTWLRWAGVGFLAGAVVLRFWRRGRMPNGDK